MSRLATIVMVFLTIVGLTGCFNNNDSIVRHQDRAAQSQAKVDSLLRQVVEANKRGVLNVTDTDKPLSIEAVSSIQQIADMLTEYIGIPDDPLKDWQAAPALTQELRDAKRQAVTDAEKANAEARAREEELKQTIAEYTALKDEYEPMKERYAETSAQLVKYEGMVKIPYLVTLAALGVFSAGGLCWFGVAAWLRKSRSMSQAIGLAAIAIACAVFGGVATTWWYMNGRFVIQWAYAVLFLVLISGGVYLAVVSGALKSVIRGAQAGMDKMDVETGDILKDALAEHQSPSTRALVRTVRDSEGLRKPSD